ncbi:MOB kinase activator 1A isoform X2 [Phycodurus eques]|uniref:MOB kinase activator 1A isoform X2 n=2 Tax=Syngnathinae TaxID=129914 RepID=UPI002ACE4C5B|nr:MOB kinase activator 1A isoform X2 [Phycodurus eques]
MNGERKMFSYVRRHFSSNVSGFSVHATGGDSLSAFVATGRRQRKSLSERLSAVDVSLVYKTYKKKKKKKKSHSRHRRTESEEVESRHSHDRFAKMSFLFSRSSKTFKPKKNIPEGSHQYELLKHAEATLGSGNLRQAVMLPEGEDLNEWIAVNTVDFFNQINMLYGTITEFCTESSCSVMSAGPRYEYHWADGTNIKKPIKCSAPKYIDYLMTWVQDQLDDETLFPSKIGVPFPKNFMSVAKTILKRLFRVYAHIYHQHFDSVMQLQEEAHLNTSFKHFIFFVQEFNLIDRRELAPLQDLIEKLGSKDR